MDAARLRPTFEIESAKSASDLMACLRTCLYQRRQEFDGRFTGQHVTICIAKNNRHFWSPWLNLEISKGEIQTRIHGRFSPHPSIWTGFMLAYLMISVVIFFGLMFGISQQLATQTPWAYWVAPVGLLVAGILWMIARMGPRLADEEMKRMKALIDGCCGQGSGS